MSSPPPEQQPPTPHRRGFFRALARETAAWTDECAGVPQLSLRDLPALPDAAIAGLVPEVLPGVEIIVNATDISARLPSATASVRLFANVAEDVLAFNQFNGQTTLADAAAELARALSWPGERAFAQVRQLFVRLVQLRVCAPTNTPTGR